MGALKPYHAKAAEVPREHRFGGQYSRTGFIMENALIAFVWLKDWQWPEDVPPDRHPYDQWMYVVQGALEQILWEKDAYLCEAGDVMYIPRDVPHRVRMVNDKPIFCIEVFSPIRHDYLHIAEHQFTAGVPPREPDGSRQEQRTMAEVFGSWLADPAYRDSAFEPQK
jgi:mannose-6-phosphate isomerase-like protein (cupin superfamily)